MKRYRIKLVNSVALQAAYDEDRRPNEGEGYVTLTVAAQGISFLNGLVQAEMVARGYQHNEWKILSYESEEL